ASARVATAPARPQPAPAARAPVPVTASAATGTPTSSSAPKPAAIPATPRKPADPLASAALNESERRALAAMPLPKLPTLKSREALTAQAASAQAAGGGAPVTAAPIGAGSAEAATARDALVLLKRANDRIGLGDLELAMVQSAEKKIANGEYAAAIESLALLNADLDRSVRLYTAAKSENLRAVAGREEGYSNAALWPLIWRANLEALPEPWQLQRDQKLIIPRFPPIADVVAALRYAQEHPQDVVRPEARTAPRAATAAASPAPAPASQPSPAPKAAPQPQAAAPAPAATTPSPASGG
ncbi:MAG: hypothetical protein ACT6T0_15855, partial [Nevskia sp.]